jgi:hypothetical protein
MGVIYEHVYPSLTRGESSTCTRLRPQTEDSEDHCTSEKTSWCINWAVNFTALTGVNCEDAAGTYGSTLTG